MCGQTSFLAYPVQRFMCRLLTLKQLITRCALAKRDPCTVLVQRAGGVQCISAGGHHAEPLPVGGQLLDTAGLLHHSGQPIQPGPDSYLQHTPLAQPGAQQPVLRQGCSAGLFAHQPQLHIHRGLHVYCDCTMLSEASCKQNRIRTSYAAFLCISLICEADIGEASYCGTGSSMVLTGLQPNPA